jgi:hypothetical protein
MNEPITPDSYRENERHRINANIDAMHHHLAIERLEADLAAAREELAGCHRHVEDVGAELNGRPRIDAMERVEAENATLRGLVRAVYPVVETVSMGHGGEVDTGLWCMDWLKRAEPFAKESAKPKEGGR